MTEERGTSERGASGLLHGPLQEEAYLNLVRTSNLVWQGVAELLREHDLTPTQYNALRVLRDAGERGLTCGETGEGMVTHDPDITRLLDRLERTGMLERWRTPEDRRVVRSRITPQGAEMLETIETPLAELHRRQFQGLEPGEIETLTGLLRRVRAPGDG